MRLVTFNDPVGDPVIVNVDLIRTMDGDTDNSGPLTDIFFDADHKQTVRGSSSRPEAVASQFVRPTSGTNVGHCG